MGLTLGLVGLQIYLAFEKLGPGEIPALFRSGGDLGCPGLGVGPYPSALARNFPVSMLWAAF